MFSLHCAIHWLAQDDFLLPDDNEHVLAELHRREVLRDRSLANADADGGDYTGKSKAKKKAKPKATKPTEEAADGLEKEGSGKWRQTHQQLAEQRAMSQYIIMLN